MHRVQAIRGNISLFFYALKQDHETTLKTPLKHLYRHTTKTKKNTNHVQKIIELAPNYNQTTTELQPNCNHENFKKWL
jgi:hypothetical protein